jgi:hypothetical protein
LQQPKASRRADLLVEFARESAALIDALDRLSLRLTGLVKREDASIDQLMQIKHFAWAAYSAAGDAAAMVSNPLTGRPVPPGALLKYNGLVAQIDSTWTVLLDIASGPALPARLNEAIDRAMHEFFARDFSELRTKTLNALVAGEPPGITAEQWTSMAVTKLSSLLGIAEVALDIAEERAAAQRSQAMLALRIQLALLAIAAVLAIWMMLVVARRFAGPFAGKDEIGALADVAATREMTGAVNEMTRRALNATIEAARAGEADRDFAVAASEVTQLATQAAKATDEISAQIASMQAGTQKPAMAIKEISGIIGRMSDVAPLTAPAGERGAAPQEVPHNLTPATVQVGPVRAA